MRFVRQYFGQIASQSFVTAPDGTRLFYSGLPFARAYVVPDAETEERLFSKQRWLMAITLCPIVLLMPLLGRTPSAVAVIGVIVGDLVVSAVAQYFLFRTELGSLTRATTRLSWKERAAISAARHSTTTLVIYLVTALALLAAVVFLMPPGADPVLTWLSTGVFVLMAAGMSFLLMLKLSRKGAAETQPAPDAQ